MGTLNIEKVNLIDTDTIKEFYFNITNAQKDNVFVDEVELFSCHSLDEFALPKNSRLFKSGRHKNDMPGVCTLGVMNDAMKDVMSTMSETGDKQSAKGQVIVSDHITIIGDKGNYLVVSFVTGKSQMVKTVIEIDDKADFVSMSSSVEFNVYLAPGETRRTETIRIEKVNDPGKAISEFANNKAKLYGKRNNRRLSVFCTWYYYGLTVTYEDVMTNLRIMQEKKLPFDVFQIDEGWEIVLGEWKPNKKFPVPMKSIADDIKSAGYTPGIWTSPFVAHETASVWNDHPEWILKNKVGEPVLFPMNDTVYYVFDITNKATWDYFYELYRMLTTDWGYTYHKLDFTRAAVIYDDADYYDKTMTITECYGQAVKAIRRGMGEDSYFLMCGGLYDPIIGLVDAQRTGSDVLSMWSSNINKDGKTAPYTIKQSIMRYYMNEWWNNDPDALMVRRNPTMERNLRLTYGLLNDEEVKTSVINQFIGGGIVCSTEPLDKIEDDRLYELRRIMPVIDSKVRPLNIMSSDRFPENVLIESNSGNVSYIARINWDDDKSMPVEISIDETIVNGNANDTYTVCDYYSKQYKTGIKLGETVSFAELLPHAATLIKIEKELGQPIVVKSDGHFTMGQEFKQLEYINGQLEYEYENVFDYPVSYAIKLPNQKELLIISNGGR